MDADGADGADGTVEWWSSGADGNTPNGFLIFEKNFHGVRGATVAEPAVRRTCLPPPSIDPARHESMGTGSPGSAAAAAQGSRLVVGDHAFTDTPNTFRVALRH